MWRVRSTCLKRRRASATVRFHRISSADGVYGDGWRLGDDPCQNSPARHISRQSPYSASKRHPTGWCVAVGVQCGLRAAISNCSSTNCRAVPACWKNSFHARCRPPSSEGVRPETHHGT
ncbi:MAG: NAD-dependent epimerase/dehydratase family protein [Bifidobacterium pseudocatenulatum]